MLRSLALPAACLTGLSLATVAWASHGPRLFERGEPIEVRVAETWVEPPSMQAEIAPDPDELTDGYALHEWGVVRFDAGIPEIVTSGYDDRVPGLQAPTIDRPVHVRKPLIYLHPGPDFDLSTNIDITVSLAQGTLHEVWPTPALGAQPAHGNAFTWSGVQIAGESCGAQTAPQLVDLPCASLGAGHVCEAFELTAYLGEVPHCLTYDGIAAPVLLYNGEPENLNPPVHVADVVDENGGRSTRVMNISGAAIGIAYILEGRQVYRVDGIRGLGSVDTSTLTPSFWLGESDESLIESIRADLIGLGLTAGEADDFVAAWRPDVLNTTVLPWRVFGFYDRTSIDASWPLQANPAPQRIERVMAFTIENPPVFE